MGHPVYTFSVQTYISGERARSARSAEHFYDRCSAVKHHLHPCIAKTVIRDQQQQQKTSGETGEAKIILLCFPPDDCRTLQTIAAEKSAELQKRVKWSEVSIVGTSIRHPVARTEYLRFTGLHTRSVHTWKCVYLRYTYLKCAYYTIYTSTLEYMMQSW